MMSGDQVRTTGETGMQFEYLVDKAFLNNQKTELEKQASRLSKLNSLCQKSSQIVQQLKREVRAEDYTINPSMIDHLDNFPINPNQRLVMDDTASNQANNIDKRRQQFGE